MEDRKQNVVDFSTETDLLENPVVVTHDVIKKSLLWLRVTQYLTIFMMIVLALIGYDLYHKFRDQIQVMRDSFHNMAKAVQVNTTEQETFLKILILKPTINVKFAREIAGYVFRYSSIHGVDSDLVLSVIEVESNFNPRVKSSAGAVGLMQLMENWSTIFNIAGDLRDPETNIKHGIQVLRLYQEMYKDMKLALVAYNRGPSSVDWALIKDKTPDKYGYADKVLERYSWIKTFN